MDLQITIFIAMVLIISYRFKPNETVKLVVYPLVGLYVVINTIIDILNIIGNLIIGKRNGR